MSATRHDQLRHAAASTLQQIDRDHQQAGPHAQRILRLVRDNLFDPRFGVNRIRHTLGLRSSDATTRFHREIGRPIKSYILSHRLEVACRLLLETELTTHDIARLVGWRAFKSFSHTFNKKLGCRPKVYRDSGGLMSARPPRQPEKEPAPAATPSPTLIEELPRYVAGVAAVGDNACCGRCGARLEGGSAARVFEGGKAICGLCALEHAPRELVDYLFVDAARRLAPTAEEVDRFTEPERILRGIRGQLSTSDAEALIWTLACRYPRSAGVIRGILGLQDRERARRLDDAAP